MKPIIAIVGSPFELTKDIIKGYQGRPTGTRVTYEDAIKKAGGISIILSPNKCVKTIKRQLTF